VARSGGRHFDSATWLHKAKESTKRDLNDSLEALVTPCACCHIAEHGQLSYELGAWEVMKKPSERRQRQNDASVFTNPRSGRLTSEAKHGFWPGRVFTFLPGETIYTGMLVEPKR